jgi:hypothetical protein
MVAKKRRAVALQGNAPAGITPVPAEMLEQHGEVGERERLAPFNAAGVIGALRGTYEAHVDDHWRG